MDESSTGIISYEDLINSIKAYDVYQIKEHYRQFRYQKDILLKFVF